MEKNRNLIIGGLIVLLVICSIWGSVSNRSAKTLQLDLQAVTAELETLKAEQHATPVPAAPEVVTVEDPRVKELEAQIAALRNKDKQEGLNAQKLKKARKELVQIRKANKRLEAQVAQQNAVIKNLQTAVEAKQKQDAEAVAQVQALQKELALLQQESAVAAGKMQELAAANEKSLALQEQAAQEKEKLQAELSAAQEAIAASLEEETVAGEQEKELAAKLTVDIEMAQAQIVGLEKIIEEKNAALEETSRELDRVNINMDVLLGKISEQQDFLQELEQENTELVQDLTDKNKQLADLQDQLQQTPLQD